MVDVPQRAALPARRGPLRARLRLRRHRVAAEPGCPRRQRAQAPPVPRNLGGPHPEHRRRGEGGVRQPAVAGDPGLLGAGGPRAEHGRHRRAPRARALLGAAGAAAGRREVLPGGDRVPDPGRRRGARPGHGEPEPGGGPPRLLPGVLPRCHPRQGAGGATARFSGSDPAAEPRARDAPPGGRPRQPPEERVPGHDEPRAAHAAQRHPRLLRAAGRPTPSALSPTSRASI